jgi:predicted CoA-binding protein
VVMAAHPQPEVIRQVPTQTRTWAVVGCSPDPSRDPQRIARLLWRHGFRVIPVNPAVDELLGERCYPSVTPIPSAEGVEVVDIFRRADQAGAHVHEAVRIGARAVWMQLGVIDELRSAAPSSASQALRITTFGFRPGAAIPTYRRAGSVSAGTARAKNESRRSGPGGGKICVLEACHPGNSGDRS